MSIESLHRYFFSLCVCATMAEEPINITKIIGVVADIRRDAENDYGSERCNIFGLVEEEYQALTKIAIVTPKKYSFEKCDRITVHCRFITFFSMLFLDFLKYVWYLSKVL